MEARAKKMKGGIDVRRPKRLLSGILKCGHCGSGMSSHGEDPTTGNVRIRCSRSKESGTCGNRRTYRLEKIEKAVVSGLQAQLAHKELLAEYGRIYREERRDEASKIARERGTMERRPAEITGQMDRLMQALTRGILPIDAIEGQYLPSKMNRRLYRRS
jgi:site-specific DNA recombinase